MTATKADDVDVLTIVNEIVRIAVSVSEDRSLAKGWSGLVRSADAPD